MTGFKGGSGNVGAVGYHPTPSPARGPRQLCGAAAQPFFGTKAQPDFSDPNQKCSKPSTLIQEEKPDKRGSQQGCPLLCLEQKRSSGQGSQTPRTHAQPFPSTSPQPLPAASAQGAQAAPAHDSLPSAVPERGRPPSSAPSLRASPPPSPKSSHLSESRHAAPFRAGRLTTCV